MEPGNLDLSAEPQDGPRVDLIDGQDADQAVEDGDGGDAREQGRTDDHSDFVGQTDRVPDQGDQNDRADHGQNGTARSMGRPLRRAVTRIESADGSPHDHGQGGRESTSRRLTCQSAFLPDGCSLTPGRLRGAPDGCCPRQATGYPGINSRGLLFCTNQSRRGTAAAPSATLGQCARAGGPRRRECADRPVRPAIGP